MALFDGKSKEEKQAEKVEKLMAKYGLQNISREYADAVKDISQELAGTGMMETGLKLSLAGKPEDQLKISYLNAIMQQNWIIIRLLDQIANTY